jgi:hypothetical protein
VSVEVDVELVVLIVPYLAIGAIAEHAPNGGPAL